MYVLVNMVPTLAWRLYELLISDSIVPLPQIHPDPDFDQALSIDNRTTIAMQHLSTQLTRIGTRQKHYTCSDLTWLS